MELLAYISLSAFLLLAAWTVFYKSPQIEKLENRDHEDLADANKIIGSLEDRVLDYVKKIHELEHSLDSVQNNFSKLQHQKISADVKMGQKSENLLPFLSSFPYKDDEIRGLFNPIDLIVFREDEVVFVEVKSGQSQLSDKQRKIRDQIKNGKVRFEIHRMDEKGVRVK